MKERIKNFIDFTLNEKELPDSQGKILVILGAPGSGKGTLSKMLKEKYKFEHISTGELIRKSDDPEIKKIVGTGKFLSDDLMVKMLRKEMKKIDIANTDVILDGFPRTIKQAKRLDSMLGKMGLGLNHAIFLDLPDDVAKERIKKRAKIEGREDDSSDEVVDKRFEEYHDKTFPLLDFYSKSRKLITLKADKGKDDLLKQIRKKLQIK
jgi:adenylate kinase